MHICENCFYIRHMYECLQADTTTYWVRLELTNPCYISGIPDFEGYFEVVEEVEEEEEDLAVPKGESPPYDLD